MGLVCARIDISWQHPDENVMRILPGQASVH